MNKEKNKNIRLATLLMLISILLKTILYVKNTKIIYNQLPIFLITFGITSLILLGFEYGNIRRSKLYQAIFYLIFSFIIFSDIMHYSYFESLTSVVLFSQASQLGAIKESIKALLSPDKLLLVLDLPIVIFFLIRSKREVSFLDYKKVLLTLAGLSLISYAGLSLTGNLPAIKSQELYSYHIRDIKNLLVSADNINLEDLKALRSSSDEEVRQDKKHFGLAKDRNLILIQVEALQNFVINLNYNNQEITPNLNKLIKDKGSLYFDNYFQSIGRGNTSDAEFVSNNSLYPSMEEFTYKQFEKNTFYGLPWILKEAGYTPWVYHGFEKEFWNREKAYVNQGFERFLSEEDFDFEETIGFGISDREFLQQTLAYMKEQDSIDENPFYSFIITLTSHTPYTMDEKYHVLDILPEHDNIVGDYLQAVHYTDAQLGNFIEGLKSEGLYDNSIIALYGDHFGVNNSDESVFEPMMDILGEEYYFDHIMNIPLIINLPNTEINETISRVGSQMDLYPTLLNLLGLENEKGLMFGKDLLNFTGKNSVKPQTIMRKGSFITEDIVFCFAGDGIFEHSSALNRHTRKKVDISPYRDEYEAAIDEINLGNMVLKNNILKELVEKNGDLNSISLERKDNQFSKIRSITNLSEDTAPYLDEELKKNQILRVDMDKNLVKPEDLSNTLGKNKTSKLLVKSNGDSTREDCKFKLLKNINPDLVKNNRYIAEYGNFEDHYFIQTLGYNNLILNVTKQNYREEEIIDFFKTNKHLGLIIDKSKISRKLKKNLKKLDVSIFVETKTGLKKIS